MISRLKFAGATPAFLRSLAVAAGLGASLAGALASSASAETLSIALSSTVNTLDPTQAQVVGTDVSVAAHLYSPLVARGPEGKLYGVLAESWQPEGDAAWLFNLKPGVTFPGGEPLDAEAVKWNIDRIRNPETKSRNRAWFDPVSEVEVVGPTQVRIKTKGPYPTLPDQLSMIFFLSPDWMKSHNPATEAYGTGPYTLKQFVAGDRLILAPNDKAALEKPTFDEVSMRVVPEASARVAGILAGELDLAFDLPLEDVERIKKSGRADAGWVPSSRSMVVRMNTLKAPLAGNTKLRQALNYAVDKEGMVEALLGGLGTVSQCQIMTPAYFGFNKDLKPYPYDPAKAKQLLKEAGVTTPLKIDLEVPLNRYFMASEIGQIVAGQLQEVGVEATIKEMDFGAWVKTYAGRDMGQMALLGQAWPTLDADGMLSLYAAANPTAYFDDKPFDEALKAGRGTTDPAKRLEAYKTATARMCEEAPVIFLFAQPFTYGTSKKVTWKARGDDWVRAIDVVKK